MYTFSKTVTSNIAYEVSWGTGKREDGIGGYTNLFETLQEAQEFVKTKSNLYTATICKKEFIQNYKDGEFTPRVRGVFDDIRDH